MLGKVWSSSSPLVRGLIASALAERWLARQQYHEQIARVLEAQFGEVVETQPELVAQHYTEAGLTEQAIAYWQKAGQRASQRSANAEASSRRAESCRLWAKRSSCSPSSCAVLFSARTR